MAGHEVLQVQKMPNSGWSEFAVVQKVQFLIFPFQSEEVFEAIPLTNFNFEIPSNFAGKWRLKIRMIFSDLLANQEECREFKFDIMEA